MTDGLIDFQSDGRWRKTFGAIASSQSLRAFRRADLKGFLLNPGYQKFSVHQQASALLWRWPELIDVIERFSPPTLIGVPQSKSAKLNPLQW
jgi:hypothetical protein